MTGSAGTRPRRPEREVADGRPDGSRDAEAVAEVSIGAGPAGGSRRLEAFALVIRDEVPEPFHFMMVSHSGNARRVGIGLAGRIAGRSRWRGRSRSWGVTVRCGSTVWSAITESSMLMFESYTAGAERALATRGGGGAASRRDAGRAAGPAGRAGARGGESGGGAAGGVRRVDGPAAGRPWAREPGTTSRIERRGRSSRRAAEPLPRSAALRLVLSEAMSQARGARSRRARSAPSTCWPG